MYLCMSLYLRYTEGTSAGACCIYLFFFPFCLLEFVVFCFVKAGCHVAPACIELTG